MSAPGRGPGPPPAPRILMFLPGASGAGAFWRPLAERRPPGPAHGLLDWPGLGEVPPRPDVGGLADLVRLVALAPPDPDRLRPLVEDPSRFWPDGPSPLRDGHAAESIGPALAAPAGR